MAPEIRRSHLLEFAVLSRIRRQFSRTRSVLLFCTCLLLTFSFYLIKKILMADPSWHSRVQSDYNAAISRIDEQISTLRNNPGKAAADAMESCDIEKRMEDMYSGAQSNPLP